MGFYIRKGISVGPLRFNLSKSGVGVSAGFRGFRVGAGPRGNYVHMGRHGLYYRATLPRTSPSTEAMPSAAPTPLDTGQLTEIESGSVTAMRDSSSSELLAELDDKRKTTRLFPFTVLIAAVILIAAATANRPVVLVAVIGLVGVGLWLTWSRDQLAKTTVLLYDLESDAQDRYQQLHDTFDALAQCQGTWHVEAEGTVEDRKRHAGASSVVRRRPVRLVKGEPPFVRTNVLVPSIPVGRQTLWFFPDRVLVFDTAAVGAVSYLDLRIRRATTRFVEDGNVPSDSQVVDRTWKYVNKKGGPDKRFKDNRELPIVLYEDVHLSSATGLNELLQVSRCGSGEALEGAVRRMAELGGLRANQPAV